VRLQAGIFVLQHREPVDDPVLLYAGRLSLGTTAISVRNPNPAARRLPRCEKVVVAFSARPPTRTDRPDAQDGRGATTV
jgi:hypothetical protein